MLLKNKTGRDYLFTFITEFVVILAGILVYRLAAGFFGEEGFSLYSISRRTASFIQPLLILGAGVGLPRYVAFALNDTNMRPSGSYLFSATVLILIVTIPTLTVIILWAPFFSELFFGSKSYAPILFYISSLVAGMVMHAIVYGYLRGKVKMAFANLIQLLNLGAIPLLAFYFGEKIEHVLLFTGAAWIIVSSILLCYLFLTEIWNKSDFTFCFKELLNYGIQRVPGDFALAGFFALPAYIIAHIADDGLKMAGYVAFGISLLNMAGAAFVPISLILLPKASEIIIKKDFASLKVYIKRITILTFSLTMIGFLITEIFTEEILKIYLGVYPPELVHSIRIIIIAALGYTLYVSLRSILDAYYVKAINTRNIFIAFIFYIASSFTFNIYLKSVESVLYSFVISMWILGALTYFEVTIISKKHIF